MHRQKLGLCSLGEGSQGRECGVAGRPSTTCRSPSPTAQAALARGCCCFSVLNPLHARTGRQLRSARMHVLRQPRKEGRSADHVPDFPGPHRWRAQHHPKHSPRNPTTSTILSNRFQRGINGVVAIILPLGAFCCSGSGPGFKSQLVPCSLTRVRENPFSSSSGAVFASFRHFADLTSAGES